MVLKFHGVMVMGFNFKSTVLSVILKYLYFENKKQKTQNSVYCVFLGKWCHFFKAVNQRKRLILII